MSAVLQTHNSLKLKAHQQESRLNRKRRRETENNVRESVDDILGNVPSRLPLSQAVEEHCSGAPSSYVGLIPGGIGLSVQPHDRPSRKVKTFHDIAGASQQDTTGAADIPLSQRDWLPPVLKAPKALGAAGAAVAPAAIEASLQPTAVAPLDWSMKQSVKLTSSAPFTVWEEARSAPRVDVIKAERSFATCADAAPLSLQQRLIAATLTWQHPANPQPPAAASKTSQPGPSPAAAQRYKDWQEALCSLYDCYRNGQCDAFYVAPPQVPSGNARRPVAVLFGAAGVGARRRMHAIVTRSTVGLRALLQRQGIGFAAPLLAENNNNSQGAEGLRSMLVFEGAMRVHALFDFLLNRARSLHDDACDVPVLMAPTQFVGASMQRYTLEASSGTAAARAAGKAASAVYKLEVKGSQPVPAWVLDRVLSVMTVTQGSAGVTVLSEPATDTLPFNWQPEGTSAAEGDGCDLEDCAARQGGCLSVEEAMRWRRGAPGLGVAGIRELSYSYSAGTFTANKLTSRVAAVP